MTKDSSGVTGYCQTQLRANSPGETKQMSTKARMCFHYDLHEGH